MKAAETTPRRSFLARILGAAAAAGLPVGATSVAAQQAGADDWIKEVKGTHRTLFDFPRHNNFFAQLHILNYLNTYKEAYKAQPGQVGAVGTLYSLGPGSSIALGFNDSIWAKYALGEYHGLKDKSGKAYTYNIFNRPTKDDVHLMLGALGGPNIPAFADFMPGMGIANLQQMGTKFILCNNALGGWVLELEARGKGKAADIEKDLRANLLPGVTIVPAMVIAIDKAQEAGIKYNRQ